ncbi:MAG: c-type cytochrome [Pseudomonadota bacterium]|nr:c-type cytochrome [Pseudomonadota bacterium]MDP1903499.1 c-type cytochrome [Pseudomonadota bacterium]MDP2351544.1 c-type cytochrome [Pseudomonadota bacterium]
MWLLLLFAAPAWAASEWTIPVGESAGPPPLDPLDAAWTGAPAAAVPLYPQATAPGGLSRAYPKGHKSPLLQEARVLRGGGKLALRLAWPDATADLADPRATDRFADAAAVQFAPVDATLPYVGMGEPGRPVRVWLWRAGRPAESLTAQGFGSLARQPNEAVEAQARRTATGWAVVLRGKESADRPAAVAFATWDGAEEGRAGRKRLSAWRALAGMEPDGKLLEEARVGGDPARGASLYAEHGCAACHTAGVGLGPNLTHAGGIHWPGYLRRALLEPTAFVVPGYAAIMPAPPLRPEETDDLVAYLLTLH